MGKLEIGLYDVFTQATMAQARRRDVYDEHIRTAQEAEQLGYKYYFSIEHQTSTISYLSAPNVYLTALARNTSAIRFGVMIYQLPFHHPIRRKTQRCSTICHGVGWSLVRAPACPPMNSCAGTCPLSDDGRSARRPSISSSRRGPKIP